MLCSRAFPGCFLPGAGARHRTGNSGCTIIVEPIVWGKGRIRACSHPPVSRCAERMWWGSQGCRRSTKLRAGFVQSSSLAQKNPPLWFFLGNLGVKENWE